MMKYLDKSTGRLKNYNYELDVYEVFDTRGWIHSSWIMSLCKVDMMRRMAKGNCAFRTAPDGYIIYPPQDRIFSVKWEKMNDNSWKIVEVRYKII